MDKHEYLNQADSSAIEELYKNYLLDPQSVDISWRRFFEGFEFARGTQSILPAGFTDVDTEFRVLNLIDWYRKRGHLFTKTNPVRERRKYFPTLDIENYGLSEADLNVEFQAGKQIGIGPATLREIIHHLQETYCQSIGAEFMYIRKAVILEWLQKKMESTQNRVEFSRDEKIKIFKHINSAVAFEKFIHKKFVGQKRFSLEGIEALIPALDQVIEKGSQLGIREFTIGMAHRGRLNVLANIMQKPFVDIFREFKGTDYAEGVVLGDVKYHLGYDREVTMEDDQTVRIKLLPNPSHLETVGPLVCGMARARMDHVHQGSESPVLPIIIHGDAAIAGQGVVYELLQMSQLPGYRTGGTIHLVLNNQVGFTTNYLEARSSTYCTDVAKVVKSPVFHVNGDDVEALIYTIRLAVEFRQLFHQDVFIDILGYRKYGHNEGDEPRFTQPLLYKAIEKHSDIREIYAKRLIDEGVFDQTEKNQIIDEFENQLESCYNGVGPNDKIKIKPFLLDDWTGFMHSTAHEIAAPVNTRVDRSRLTKLLELVTLLPTDRNFFQKAHKIIENRKKLVDADQLDWATGELLAYGSLLQEGISIRLSGQDSERGTFAHRHAAWVQEDSGEKYYPLKQLDQVDTSFTVLNSPLSEYAVLGFEYGYALARPQTLTIWEAQFGDFANNAQVIIDQYLVSAEEKWGLQNGLVLLLPHGYEGQGPEHSSARIERFLTMAANLNINVVNPTTPANFFHLLRRQMIRRFRVPLVTFSPKSLLRHPNCTSPLRDFESGGFQEVIDDPNTDPDHVKRVVFCWGKMYYELLKPKAEWNARDIALVRIEQMYPFPHEAVKTLLKKYPKAQLHIWVQEEPENMGAWPFIKNEVTYVDWIPVCRKPSGSPATGLNRIHQITQQELIDKVFRRCTCELRNTYCGLQCVEGKSRIEILREFEYL